MRALISRRRAARAHRDPAPSRWGYRYQRLMLTPTFRALLRIGVPVLLILSVAGYWFAKPANRDALNASVEQLKTSIQERPEFMVAAMSVDGADDGLAAQVRAALPIAFPISSFALDLVEIRATVEELAAVRRATVRVKPGGILDVDITQRLPAAVWRQPDGLHLVDDEGVLIGSLAARSDRGDLPLIAGEGAKDAIAEALALFAATGPISSRVRGLVRMGERRWDVVLDRDQRILLPTTGPVEALERVIALAQAEDMLERDIALIDMRHASRPTIRLTETAFAALRGNEETKTRTGN